MSFLFSRQADLLQPSSRFCELGRPLSARPVFCVDFLPPFWGHLKQSVLLQGSWRRVGFFQKGSLTLQFFVCATHQRVVLDQTMMLHQTVQRSQLVGPWPKNRSGFALWPAAARTTLETEAQKSRNAVYVRPLLPFNALENTFVFGQSAERVVRVSFTSRFEARGGS